MQDEKIPDKNLEQQEKVIELKDKFHERYNKVLLLKDKVPEVYETNCRTRFR